MVFAFWCLSSEMCNCVGKNKVCQSTKQLKFIILSAILCLIINKKNSHERQIHIKEDKILSKYDLNYSLFFT